MSTWNMYSFQDSNSVYSDNLISFHNFVMMFIVVITSLTLFFIVDFVTNSFINLMLLKNHTIEVVWTIIPMIVLAVICYPSLKILYFIDDVSSPYFSIKAIGHQWYWSYEYPEFNNYEINSYMLVYSNSDHFRLIETDNRMVVPFKISIRLIVSSLDVIHSWTIQSLGLKVDAVPGRVNQLNLVSTRPGLYFGQCSEICGVNHSFMPIMLESTDYSNFVKWVNSNLSNW
uniref:cytochrome c oxidase subunit II n=1 Tax=Tetragonula iridipennis TaxID=597212 RepID=UPI0026E1F2DC|nr:cytochrome c oxidase subunit II [Tetragonula iridipennis]WJQ22755.1 cytochrome c oxidase subunit II [Tetragonula iridipennis]